MSLIVLDHLEKSYGTIPALRDLSLQVPEGCLYGLLGPNGAGKTTTLRILATLLAPDLGDVLLNVLLLRYEGVLLLDVIADDEEQHDTLAAVARGKELQVDLKDSAEQTHVRRVLPADVLLPNINHNDIA